MGKYASDDDAPEVVTKSAAKEDAIAQRRVEKEARRSNLKRKRVSRKRLEVKSDEQKSKDETPQPTKLPDNVIELLANQESEKQSEEESSVSIKVVHRQNKPNKILHFGTIQVEKLSNSTTPSYEVSPAALAFTNRRLAPGRQRVNIVRGHDAYFRKDKSIMKIDR
uniref:AlNc14C181G8221 protein n=1 Tax=Albugo laibachii Nc14 TaxID=890382 RepID=F0WP73_9STRA|nr:AlNc14C181G8221 [Albugo laibachii Nc14]|eukprot:CCA23119.1 AlNc14C181G8221 [Albugo laibachii Nc14]